MAPPVTASCFPLTPFIFSFDLFFFCVIFFLSYQVFFFPFLGTPRMQTSSLCSFSPCGFPIPSTPPTCPRLSSLCSLHVYYDLVSSLENGSVHRPFLVRQFFLSPPLYHSVSLLYTAFRMGPCQTPPHWDFLFLTVFFL